MLKYYVHSVLTKFMLHTLAACKEKKQTRQKHTNFFMRSFKSKRIDLLR